MIWIVIIAVVITTLAGTIAYSATRSGGFGAVGRAILTQSRSGSRLINATLVFFYVGFGIALPAVMLIGNRDKASAQVAGLKLSSNERAGRLLFGEHCAVCHTLDAAAAVGKTGPDLDQLRPSESLVLYTLEHGCLQNPGPGDGDERCLGYGNMPADVVQGTQAEDVAQFVARVAGHS